MLYRRCVKESHPVSRVDSDRFCEMVKAAKEYIAAGDIYQVNLSHRFTAPWKPLSPREWCGFYQQLRERSPAPYAAFLDQGDRQVFSSSPELFLQMDGRTAKTRPIKGTRPRFDDIEQDEKSAYDLQTSPKEISELVMITDLERNDLGQICDFGSVHATDLLKLERFAQVFHLVSTVEGDLRPDIDHIDALAACFPGGSITGAPKKRATEIITELEPEPRGLYTGAIGIFGFNNQSTFNIAIRTAILEGQTLSFHVGAGIVADSDPLLEWEETLHKAAGIKRACSGTDEFLST
ncbi:MAG: anthranilate synthase component I family protein [Verrucomicrobiota bacterium]